MQSNHVNDGFDYESSIDLSVFEDKEEAFSSIDITPMSRSIDSINSNINSSNNNNNKGNDIEILDTVVIKPNEYSMCKLNNRLNNINEDIESPILEMRRNKSFIQRLNHKNNVRKRMTSRLSILGKPLPSYRMKNNILFYKQRIAVFNFLHRPQGFLAVSYHMLVSCVVFICLVLTILSTISDYETEATYGLTVMDSLIVVIFSSEFLSRLWSSSCKSQYQGWNGKLHFIQDPFRIIDIFVILTSGVLLFFDTNTHKLQQYFRGFRFFQVFQMLRLEHRFRPWRMMASVVWAQREHLAITTYMGFLSLLFISFLIYFIEKDVNPAFNSIASTMWWGVITLCTVGYGDMTPVTSAGKFLSCICIIMGVSIFALPAGILGTGLALKVQEQQRQRQMTKRREPAAKLLQCLWRCCTCDHNSTSIATWNVYLIPNTTLSSLSMKERNAIRFIRILKYLIAKRNFSKVFKPYDIKDVMEQYAAGHADVLGRVRQMQNKLNTVQASLYNNMKAVQESKALLTTQMENIECLTNDLQMKFNEILKLRLSDRTLIETVTSIMATNKTNCDNTSHTSVPSRQRSNSF